MLKKKWETLQNCRRDWFREEKTLDATEKVVRGSDSVLFIAGVGVHTLVNRKPIAKQCCFSCVIFKQSEFLILWERFPCFLFARLC